ncbi:RNA recognition motif-containing protein [Cyclospora cayetanensis]|uniref:RNA recognition motif-containing protein n=1 Tax=Cyclospora cayetanensis TaxID=88456 RepID=A0A1D3D607_9EIME|nr:RNA recognition motif-containing protein [Cyclospora cayetanensis]
MSPGMGGGSPMPPSNANPRAAGPWKEYFSPEGRPYYHNEMTGVTTWERPLEFMQAPPPGPPGTTPGYGGGGHMGAPSGFGGMTQGGGPQGGCMDDGAGGAPGSRDQNAGGKRLKVTIKKGEEQHAVRPSPMGFNQGGGMPPAGAPHQGGPRDGQWGGAYNPQTAAGGYGQSQGGFGGAGAQQQQRFAPY